MANIRRRTAGIAMEIAPLLFDLGTSKPTSRQVADLVKAGGADALTEAIRRADAARYQEIRCRSALNSCKGMPFNWTLNPYRGCTHGCHYCYARRYHTQFELGADDEFASIIFVKTNVVQVLRRELQRAGLDQRPGRAWNGHRLLPADRRVLQTHARCARSVLRLQHTDRRRDEGSDGRARQGRAHRSVSEDRRHRLHQRAVRGRRRVARARARHRSAASTAARGEGARRQWSSSRRPDEPDRPGHLVEARADRAHREDHRGPRRPLHRVATSCTCEEGTRDHFMRWLAAGIPAPRRRIPAALRRQVPAQGVPRRGEDCRRNDDAEVRSRQ